MMKEQGKSRGKACLVAKDKRSAYHPGYLCGLPILVKDNAAVAGVQWSTGFFRDRVPTESDPLVLRLVRVYVNSAGR